MRRCRWIQASGLMELGRLRREVTAVEPVGEERKLLLHELASREVCGFDGCPSRMRARQHARELGFSPEILRSHVAMRDVGTR